MRQLYSVRNERLGITFKPANNPAPSSMDRSVTWLTRRLPINLGASKANRACNAGICFVPGYPACATARAQPFASNKGRNRNSPATAVRITAAGESQEACYAAMEPTVATIRECLGDLVFGEGDDEDSQRHADGVRECGPHQHRTEVADPALARRAAQDVQAERDEQHGGLLSDG